MADRAVSPCSDELPLPQQLAHVCDVLVRHAAAADGARIIRLRRAPGDDNELEIGIRPLRTSGHPVDELVGMAAPNDWLAVGVSARGRLSHVDDPDAAAVPVHTAHLVGRDGAWASRWQRPTARAEASESGGSACGRPGDPSMPTGRVDDACRRALGLPTPAAPTTTVELFAVLWLDAVVAVAGSASGRGALRQWCGIATAHPATAWFGPGAVRSPADLVRLGRELGEHRPWADLRRDCVGGHWATPGVEPAVAAWLDEGAFARWVLGALPDLADLHAAVAGLLAPAMVAHIDDALAGWDLDGRTP